MEEVILDDPASYSSTKTTSPISVVPSRVFTERGKWASKNNPTYSNVGYYANTGPYAGSVNNLTYIIRWEYVYNGVGNILSNNTDSSIGSTGIKVIEISEYIYNKSQNKIEHTSNSAPLRIKSPTVAVGLGSDQQIMKWGRSNGGNFRLRIKPSAFIR